MIRKHCKYACNKKVSRVKAIEEFLRFVEDLYCQSGNENDGNVWENDLRILNGNKEIKIILFMKTRKNKTNLNSKINRRGKIKEGQKHIKVINNQAFSKKHREIT